MRRALLCLLFFAATCFGETASFLSDSALPSLNSRAATGEFREMGPGYLAPTEHNQIESMAIVQDAPRGAYVSVGLERSFIGAAITPGADHLVIVDRDARIIALARFNAGLLAIARDRADYVRLRLQATAPEIAERAKEREIPSDYAAALADPHTFALLQRTVRARPLFADNFDSLHEVPPIGAFSDGFDYTYRDANYLYNERLFVKLKNLAREGRITALECDLTDARSIATVADGLRKKKVGLSVLDVSDTWYHSRTQPFNFLPPEKSLALWRGFAPSARPESILLMTGWYPNPRHESNDPRGIDFWPWIYFGLTYDKVIDPQASSAALTKMLNYSERKGSANPRWQGTLNFPGAFDSLCRFFNLAPFVKARFVHPQRWRNP